MASKYVTQIEKETSQVINDANVKTKIEQVNDFLKNNHDATSFIYFKVNDFVLDTRSKDSRDHYAITMENQKTGAGAGNQFTIKIAYNPYYSEYSSAIELERAISVLPKSLLEGESSSEIRQITKDRNKCVLQYGYLDYSKGTYLITEEYTGLLLEYEITANKQILEYTLKGVSGIEAQIGTVNWYPAIEGMAENEITVNGKRVKIAEIQAKTESGISNASSAEERKTLIQEAIKTLGNIYTGPLYMDPLDALYCFIKDYNYDIQKIDPNATTFKIVIEPNALSAIKNLKPVVLSLCRNQTPLDYIQYLISMFAENESMLLTYYKQNFEISSRWVYELKYVNNGNGNDRKSIIEIHINKISSEKAQKQNEYEFKGYTKDNVLLIDYSCKYNGAIALTVSDNMEENSNTENVVYINSNGLIVKDASITKDMFVEGAIDEILVKKQSTWLDQLSCSNNCTMTTFGLPFEIPIGTVFNVNLYIADKLHHTSGRCYVIGITDKIENNMFTTQFSMIRLPGKGGNVS